MSDYSGNIVFKEWLPDQPDFNNPGLTEALNVLPVDDRYASYYPLGTAASNTMVAAPSAPTGGFSAFVAGSNERKYASFDANIAIFSGAGSWTTLTGATTLGSSSFVKFAQFDDDVIAVGDASPTVRSTLGSTSYTALATSGVAPANARAVAIVNEFVVIGGFSGGLASVQWSGIGDSRNWPTPGSATAIAAQSGIQDLNSSDGHVYDVFGGDQFGVVMQVGRISRMTYIGGSAVFQFDAIEVSEGSYFAKGAIQVGNLIYFISRSGFCRTDGVQIEHIGEGQTDRYFWDNFKGSGFENLVSVGYDYVRRLLYWWWPSTAATNTPDQILIYNPARKRWTHAAQSGFQLITAAQGGIPASRLGGFNTARRFCFFDGPPGTATLTTGETEPNPGGFSRMSGIKPLVDQTINGITVAIGTRNDRTSAVSYTSETTANSRTGFANFRQEARYHRARLTIAGTFNAAQGLEYQSDPSGYT